MVCTHGAHTIAQTPTCPYMHTHSPLDPGGHPLRPGHPSPSAPAAKLSPGPKMFGVAHNLHKRPHPIHLLCTLAALAGAAPVCVCGGGYVVKCSVHM